LLVLFVVSAVRAQDSSPLQLPTPAVLSLASKIRMRAAGGRVTIPIRFAPAPPGPPLREAVFKTRGDLYPVGRWWPERAMRMGASGVVLADCRVLEDNRLTDCTIADVQPKEWAFDEAVLHAARAGAITAAPLAPGAPQPADRVWRFRIDFPAHGRRPK
jgi:TonB family protein